MNGVTLPTFIWGYDIRGLPCLLSYYLFSLCMYISYTISLYLFIWYISYTIISLCTYIISIIIRYTTVGVPSLDIKKKIAISSYPFSMCVSTLYIGGSSNLLAFLFSLSISSIALSLFTYNLIILSWKSIDSIRIYTYIITDNSFQYIL